MRFVTRALTGLGPRAAPRPWAMMAPRPAPTPPRAKLTCTDTDFTLLGAGDSFDRPGSRHLESSLAAHRKDPRICWRMYNWTQTLRSWVPVAFLTGLIATTLSPFWLHTERIRGYVRECIIGARIKGERIWEYERELLVGYCEVIGIMEADLCTDNKHV